VVRRAALVALLALATAAGASRLTTFQWDPAPSWSAGTTIELCANGYCETGITDTQHTLDVPVEPGDVIDARARAHDGNLTSSWATVAQTWPADPIGIWVPRPAEEPIMADIGVTDVSSGYQDRVFEAQAEIGIRISMPENGTIQSVSAYLRESTTANRFTVFALIYDSSGDLVDYSESVSDIGLTNTWVTFTGFSGASLANGQTYNVLLVANGGDGSMVGQETVDAPTGTGVTISSAWTNLEYGDTKSDWSPPDSATIATNTRLKGIYLTYSTGAAAAGLPRRALDGPFYGALRGSVR